MSSSLSFQRLADCLVAVFGVVPGWRCRFRSAWLPWWEWFRSRRKFLMIPVLPFILARLFPLWVLTVFGPVRVTVLSSRSRWWRRRRPPPFRRGPSNSCGGDCVIIKVRSKSYFSCVITRWVGGLRWFGRLVARWRRRARQRSLDRRRERFPGTLTLFLTVFPLFPVRTVRRRLGQW